MIILCPRDLGYLNLICNILCFEQSVQCGHSRRFFFLEPWKCWPFNIGFYRMKIICNKTIFIPVRVLFSPWRRLKRWTSCLFPLHHSNRWSPVLVQVLRILDDSNFSLSSSLSKWTSAFYILISREKQRSLWFPLSNSKKKTTGQQPLNWPSMSHVPFRNCTAIL